MSQKRRATTRKKKQQATMVIPVPPQQDEGTIDLSVEIRSSVGWRLKMALVQLEAEGTKTTKKAFVERALEDVLNKFDSART